jgi:hypothetical protein
MPTGIAYALSGISFVQAIMPFVADKPTGRAYRRSLNSYLCSDVEDELGFKKFLTGELDSADREEVLIGVVRRISSTTATIIAVLTAAVALFALIFVALDDRSKPYSTILVVIFVSGLATGLVLLMVLVVLAIVGKIGDYPSGRVRNRKYAFFQNVLSFRTLTSYKLVVLLLNGIICALCLLLT